MLTLGQMVKVTPVEIRKNATNVAGSITKVINKIDRKLDEPYKLVKAKARDTNGLRRLEYKLYDNGTIRSKAWVSCTCPYFLFYCEVALTAKGSSKIQFSNGKRPTTTNPKMIPILCKHLVALSQKAVKAKATN